MLQTGTRPSVRAMSEVRWPSAVPGSRFADIRHVADIGSTNQVLLDLARQGAPEGTVLVADHQHAGRGRLGRRWEAPPGTNLLVSVLLRPSLGWDELSWVTTAVALSVIDAVGTLTGVRLAAKWPNDLVVADGPHADTKVVGLLAETVGDPSGPPAVVVGCGCNVGWPGPDDPVPAELVGRATSLLALGGRPVDRPALLVGVLGALERWLTVLAGDLGPTPVREAYRAVCATLGRSVRVQRSADELEGRALDVDDAGRLVVDTGAATVAVDSGDVVHLR